MVWIAIILSNLGVMLACLLGEMRGEYKVSKGGMTAWQVWL